MIRCEVHEQNGRKVTVAKFVNNNHDDVYTIWYDSLDRRVDKLLRHAKCLTMDWDVQDKLIREILRGRKLVGVAKVAEGDTYDEVEGRKIARKQLIKRYQQAEAELDRQLVQRLNNDLRNIYKVLETEFEKQNFVSAE